MPSTDSGDITAIWGTTAAERRSAFRCDSFFDGPTDAFWRGVTIDAPRRVIFRWLCQMRVAPYSYDLVDNLGKPSPSVLTPGLDRLEIGQPMMSTAFSAERAPFRLLEFVPDWELTLISGNVPVTEIRRIAREGTVGSRPNATLITYLITSDPSKPSRCRVLVKVVGSRPGNLRALYRAAFWRVVDFFMMRAQLLNFKAHAEASGLGVLGDADGGEGPGARKHGIAE